MEKLQRRQDHCTQINSNTPQATQMCLSYADRKAIFDSATLKLILGSALGVASKNILINHFVPNFVLAFCRHKNLIMNIRNLVQSCIRLRWLVEGQVDYHRKESITHAGAEPHSSQV